MANTSPRQTFIARAPVPIDWPSEREHRGMLAKAIIALNERSRTHPVEVVFPVATYNVNDIDLLVLANATAGNMDVNLLGAAGREGRQVTVKKIDASANTVTLKPESGSGDTMDGATTDVLSAQYESRTYVSCGGNWHLVASI